MKYNAKSESSNYLITLIKGVGFSYIVTFIFIVLLALIMTYTSLSEGLIPIVNSIAMIISIVIGSIYMSIKVNKKGWLSGGAIGLVYIFILIIFSSIFADKFAMDGYLLLKVLIALVTGSVGGMIGINLK